MLLMLAWLLGDANSSPGGMKVTKTLQEVPAGTVSVFETFLEKHGGFIGAHLAAAEDRSTRGTRRIVTGRCARSSPDCSDPCERRPCSYRVRGPSRGRRRRGSR